MLTVADIRKAIQGLPDDALVALMIHADRDPEDGPLVMLTGFGQDAGRAMVYVDLMGMDDDDDMDDDTGSFEGHCNRDETEVLEPGCDRHD